MAGISNDERAYLLTGSEEYTKQIEEKSDELQNYLAEVKELPDLTEQDRQVIDRIEQGYQVFIETSKRARVANQSGDKQQAITLHFGEEREARKELDPIVSDFLQQVEANMEQEGEQLVSETSLLRTIRTLVSGGGILLALIVGVLLIRSIVKPLQVINRQLKEIAEGEGDLTREITVGSKDELGELGRSFNLMVSNLRHIIREVRSSAVQVSDSVEQLTDGAEQTSKATEQIALAIQEVAAGSEKQVNSVSESSKVVQELSTGIRNVASHAQSVSEAAVHSSDLADQGSTAIGDVADQINKVSNTMGQLATAIKGLGEQSKAIGQIVDVITDIANQTNLLALNAAIEAARAGEHGRGFAVVADEVRKLAEQSSYSANQIVEVITTIKAETDQAIEVMEAGTQDVAVGLKVATKAGELFAQIQRSVNQVAMQIAEVSTASQQMSAAAEQVVHSFRLVTDVAETAAAGTQGVSAASEEQLASMQEISASASALAKLAEHLKALIGKFRV